MKILHRRGLLVGFATLVLFTGIAGDAWRDSIGWYAYGAIDAILTTVAILILVAHRRTIRWASLPLPLLVFLALATVSIAWSDYPGASAIGVFAQYITTIVALAMVLVLSGEELLRVLGRTFRIVLGLSIVFELFVSLVIRHPVFPVWVPASERIHPPALLYWSRDLLLHGDKIQGIVGSSTLLAMIALLGLIIFGVQLAAGTVRRLPGTLWVLFAVLMLTLTRSATINLALAAVIVVLVCILLVRRAPTVRARRVTYAALGAGVVVLAGATVALQHPILAILGKSSDYTGRVGIWQAVIGLARQRPVFGWGWVSFWAPWVEPFKNLIKRGGVFQLHAHEAWLDVWLQLGIIGLIVFGSLIITTAVRAWLLATDRVFTMRGERGRYSTASLLPPLLFTAMLVQSLAESRMLIEGGWILLVILSVATKAGILGRASGSAAASDSAPTAITRPSTGSNERTPGATRSRETR